MSNITLTVKYTVPVPSREQQEQYLAARGWTAPRGPETYAGETKGRTVTFWQSPGPTPRFFAKTCSDRYSDYPNIVWETIHNLAEIEQRSQMQVYIDIMRPYPLDAEQAVMFDGHARFISYLMMHRNWCNEWLNSFATTMGKIASWQETPSLVAAKRQAVEILNKFEQDKTYPKNLP